MSATSRFPGGHFLSQIESKKLPKPPERSHPYLGRSIRESLPFQGFRGHALAVRRAVESAALTMIDVPRVDEADVETFGLELDGCAEFEQFEWSMDGIGHGLLPSGWRSGVILSFQRQEVPWLAGSVTLNRL